MADLLPVSNERLRFALRLLGPILVGSLACTGLIGAGTTAYRMSVPRPCADCANVGVGSDAGVVGTHHPAVEALASRTVPNFEPGRDETGGVKRRAGAQGVRVGAAGEAALEAEARAASRARHVARSSLDFAVDLARARAGIVLSRSTAPPPVFSA